jgi:hypothetical protein
VSAQKPYEEKLNEGKSAATPPLYRVAGEPPRLVRNMDTHNVVFFNGWYYGVPHALADFDVTDGNQSDLTGIIKQTSEEGVIAAIEEASYWANTRGQYTAQEKQRVSESYMRAGSALGETSTENLPGKLKLIRFKGEFLALSREAINRAFDSGGFGLFDWGGRPVQLDARSPLRRMATKLPPALQHKMRRIIRLQSFKEKKVSGGLVTQPDGRLLGMLWRGTLDAYLKKPLMGILRGEGGDKISPVAEGQVDGEGFSILAVVTKNALPELMWSMDGYNVVKYDGVFFGLPHGVPIDWEADDVASIPGVFTAKTVKAVVNTIESKMQTGGAVQATHATRSQAIGPAGEATRVPVLLGSLEGYNVITYEGWVYGIPQVLGPIDLTEVDTIAMPGVIRDVSRDVVESQIIDQVKFKDRIAV